MEKLMVANFILISKELVKWRLYIDFKNLSKAYLEDNYHLPQIDALIDKTN